MEVTWEEALAARRAEGEVETTRRAILLLLSRRLGPVPEEVSERLASISDIKRLQSILEQAVDASTLDEIDFAEPS